ncbi:hypothetical protein Syun_029665 [Stephania yunnanensis]|uniref:Uncharacterized protein n=1 Tax=Stephania yunnanensis TaxID=152371 RepID=A0AAP0HK27_9MAGN
MAVNMKKIFARNKDFNLFQSRRNALISATFKGVFDTRMLSLAVDCTCPSTWIA